MQIGVAFPTTEIGNDPAFIRDFAQAVEDMGYDYLTCIDHVIQSRTAEAGDWRAYYTRANPFHETLVMFGFLAGVTRRIGLASAILILPQRPTVLAAKQLAEIDVLCGGRLRAGVGIGWNAVEFEALGQDFGNRALRMEEQIAVLRALWTQELVSFEGRWHRIEDAGINPLPVQRPVPIWFGAFKTPAIERAGRLGDGLFLNPRMTPGPEIERDIADFKAAARTAGRDPDGLGLDATLHFGGRNPGALAEECEQWRELGASHVTVRTLYSGIEKPAEHVEHLRRIREVLPAR